MFPYYSVQHLLLIMSPGSARFLERF
jgi:hypothetical protein